jgi:hypothetical protein
MPIVKANGTTDNKGAKTQKSLFSFFNKVDDSAKKSIPSSTEKKMDSEAESPREKEIVEKTPQVKVKEVTPTSSTSVQQEKVQKVNFIT